MPMLDFRYRGTHQTTRLFLFIATSILFLVPCLLLRSVTNLISLLVNQERDFFMKLDRLESYTNLIRKGLEILKRDSFLFPD